jgi:hypothetical protein
VASQVRNLSWERNEHHWNQKHYRSYKLCLKKKSSGEMWNVANLRASNKPSFWAFIFHTNLTLSKKPNPPFNKHDTFVVVKTQCENFGPIYSSMNRITNSTIRSKTQLENFGPIYSHSLIRGVSHCGHAIYIKKVSLRQKRIIKNSNISPSSNTIFKKSSKRNQNPSRYCNSITNLKFQHKPKYQIL